jgi:hypothetical protein
MHKPVRQFIVGDYFSDAEIVLDAIRAGARQFRGTSSAAVLMH